MTTRRLDEAEDKVDDVAGIKGRLLHVTVAFLCTERA